jgi:hypothetical protein
MSDLGAIFHVKKSGTQYDAHAYTTTDECPYPNLKIKFKGQQAYVKMEQGKGNGDVPCYAKDKAGVIYQVKKEAVTVPTGSVSVGAGDMFSVPLGVKVIKVFWSKDEYDETSNSIYAYVGVTPGKKYELQCYTFVIWPEGDHRRETEDGVYLGSVSGTELNTWFQRTPYEDIQDLQDRRGFELSWSPEINKMKPTYTDY